MNEPDHGGGGREEFDVSLTPEAWLDRLKGGDRAAAMTGLLHLFRGKLLRLLYVRVWDKHVAEDLLQDVCIKVLSKCGSHKSGQPVWPWLRTIAVRTAIDHGRRRRPEETLTEAAQDEFLCNLEEPDARLLREADQDQLKRALARLKPMFREIIILYYFGDTTRPEIARLLGIPVGTVNSRWSAAMQCLRDDLVEPNP
jgi:RNA polymerase sigma-70 factor (ECF subfamily)